MISFDDWKTFAAVRKSLCIAGMATSVLRASENYSNRPEASC